MYGRYLKVCLLQVVVVLVVKECDNSLARQRELEREVELLKERLDASQAGWAAARSTLEDREHQAVHCEVTQLQAFLRSLAEMMSDSCIIVEASEDRIMQRLRELLAATRDKSVVSYD